MKNYCCKECKRLNSATAMMSGESAVVCVDENCSCHTPAGEAIKENLRLINNGIPYNPLID